MPGWAWPAITSIPAGSAWPLGVSLAPIVPQITTANGCQLWLDSDFPGIGIADGSTVMAPVNRSGSNAAVAAHVAGPTYRATGWGAPVGVMQSAWQFNAQALRASGSSIAGVAQGANKSWHVIMPMIFDRNHAQTSEFFDFCASNFQSDGVIVRTTSDRYKLGVFGSAQSETVDTQLFGLEPMVIDVSYAGGNITFGINGVRTSPVAFASGVTVQCDGLVLGGDYGGAAHALSDHYMRACGVWDHVLSGPEFSTMVSYIVTYYSGFDRIASLGAA